MTKLRNEYAIAAQAKVPSTDVRQVADHLGFSLPCSAKQADEICAFVAKARKSGLTINKAISQDSNSQASNDPGSTNAPSSGPGPGMIGFDVRQRDFSAQQAQQAQQGQAALGAAAMGGMAAWAQNRLATAATQAQMDAWADYFVQSGEHHPDIAGQIEVQRLIEQVLGAEASVLPQPAFFVPATGGFSVAMPEPAALLAGLSTFQQTGAAALPGGVAFSNPKALPGGQA